MPEQASNENPFDEIYNLDIWDGGSGPGSTPASTITYRAFIECFIFDNQVRSVTDLGCGDWQFSRYIDWSRVEYTGLDVVERVIAENNRKFGTSNVKFEVSHNPQELPGGDLVLCKEVLQHLPNETVTNYLSSMRQRYKFCLVTNSVVGPGSMNSDIAAGEFRPLRIDKPPFSARGAHILSYYPFKEREYWIMKNSVFLMLGEQ